MKLDLRQQAKNMAEEKYKINNDLQPMFDRLKGYFNNFSKDQLSNQDLNKAA